MCMLTQAHTHTHQQLLVRCLHAGRLSLQLQAGAVVLCQLSSGRIMLGARSLQRGQAGANAAGSSRRWALVC
jgi:hypothetical protein